MKYLRNGSSGLADDNVTKLELRNTNDVTVKYHYVMIDGHIRSSISGPPYPVRHFRQIGGPLTTSKPKIKACK